MRNMIALALALPLLAACGKEEPPAPAAPPVTVVPDNPVQPPPPPPLATPAPATDAAAPAAMPEPAPSESPAMAAGTYVVTAGDTLYKIASEHGLNHKDLARWNGIKDPRRLRVGQELKLAQP